MATSRAHNVTVTHNSLVQWSRGDILDWFNETLQCNLINIEQLCTGAAYCNLMHMLYPKLINLKRVKFFSNQEYEYVNNFKELQKAFNKVNVSLPAEVNDLIKGHRVENFKFAVWFRHFFNVNHTKEKCAGYDALVARDHQNIGIGSSKLRTKDRFRLVKVKTTAIRGKVATCQATINSSLCTGKANQDEDSQHTDKKDEDSQYEDSRDQGSQYEDSPGMDSQYKDCRDQDSQYEDSHGKDSHYKDCRDQGSQYEDSHGMDSQYEDSRDQDSQYEDSPGMDSQYKDSRDQDSQYEDSHGKDSQYKDCRDQGSQYEDSHGMDSQYKDSRDQGCQYEDSHGKDSEDEDSQYEDSQDIHMVLQRDH
uniref:AT09431p n=1 Tax=Drosophila melanogaster TaxID=7227 RepID=Q8T3Q9_DROME|nr:AT09431p [Drosophila melanogaster]